MATARRNRRHRCGADVWLDLYEVNLRPDLLILDDAAAVTPAATEGIERLSRASRRTLARVHDAAPTWLSDAHTISWDVDAVVPDRRDRYHVQVVPYRIEATERSLIEEAIAFLESVAGPLEPDAVTRDGIQRRLQRLESASGSDSQVDAADEPPVELVPEQQARLAELLDQFDDLGADTRLQVLASLVNQARRDERPCIVVADSLRELGYVVSYLRDDVAIDIEELTSRVPPETIPLIQAKLREGGTVVASAGFVENGDELPSRTVNIWLTAPRSRSAAEARLGVGFNSSGISVYVLVSEPPLSSSRPSQAAIGALIGRQDL